MKQQTLFPVVKPENEQDVIFTPEYIAEGIINHFKPSGKCLDPCKGNGAFLKYLPINSDWCEITEGKDFFDYRKKVDWIVGNPPYSIFEKWLIHSFKVADNIVYLIPITKALTSYRVMKQIYELGSICEIFVLGAGRHIGFPFGFAIGAVHFKPKVKTDIKITFKET